MKKLITLSLIALFAVGNLMAFNMNWNGEARVRGGMVMNDGYNSDNLTTTWKAQRIRLFWNGEADNGVKFVVRSHLSNGDVSDGANTIDLDRAYIVIPDAFLGFTVTAGLMPFYACNGLVADTEKPGYYFAKSMGDISVGFGGFTTKEGSSNKYSKYQDATVAGSDAHGFIANFSMNNAGPGTFGLDIMAKTNVNITKTVNDEAVDDPNYEHANYFWISPWYSMSAGDFSVNVNPVILTGGYDLQDGVTESDDIKNVSGSVVALIVKPSFTIASTGTSLSGDVLYVQGTTKADELSWKNIGSFYCSGLEFFGSANEIDHYGAIGNGAGASGQMSLIVKADQPLTSALTLHFAAGHLMTAEDVTLADKKTKDNVLGTEIDLGLRWAVKENVTWKFTAAYVMPGDASTKTESMTAKDDAITSLTSYLGYSF